MVRTPATFDRSCRVIKSKKSGGHYPIPFRIDFTAESAQRDQVPDTQLVAPRAETVLVETVEEGIALYLEGFSEKFTERNYARRARHLRRFVEYLKGTGHSMRLQDLTHGDGVEFLEKLSNARTGKRLSLAIKQDYKSALRSFSRFLVQSGVLKSDVFFELTVE